MILCFKLSALDTHMHACPPPTQHGYPHIYVTLSHLFHIPLTSLSGGNSPHSGVLVAVGRTRLPSTYAAWLPPTPSHTQPAAKNGSRGATVFCAVECENGVEPQKEGSAQGEL